MSIPKTIKISGYEFKVNLSTRKELEDDFGTMDMETLTICIEKGIDEQLQYSTLLHEVIETINYIHELDLDHSKIMTLETCLYQVLCYNNLQFGKKTNIKK